jgi:hypothetical protein
MKLENIRVGDNVIVCIRDKYGVIIDEFSATVSKIPADGYVVVKDQYSHFFSVTADELSLNKIFS